MPRLHMSELSSAATDTPAALMILGTSNILMQVKKPTELYNTLCYKCYYKHAWWCFWMRLVSYSMLHLWQYALYLDWFNSLVNIRIRSMVSDNLLDKKLHPEMCFMVMKPLKAIAWQWQHSSRYWDTQNQCCHYCQSR